MNATTTAREPNELYDNLSQVGQDHWDDIARMGYVPNKTDAGWTATKSGGGTAGPCESLVVLYNEVKVTAAGSASQSGDTDAPRKLSLGDAARYSELTQWGWKVDGADKAWSATEIAGEQRKVGPATSIKALHTQVQLAAGLPRTNGKPAGEATDDPSSRLPGMEEPAIEELDRLSDSCIDAKEKKESSKAAFDDQCDVMREKMREYGRKRYSRRGFSLVIEDTEKLVIKKAEKGQPKNPRATKVVKAA